MKNCKFILSLHLLMLLMQLSSNNLFGQYKTGSGDGFFVATGFLNPLPVELLSFEKELRGSGVLLTWQTASEINNEKFILEKSFDLQNWFQIYEVKGAGNSYNILNYSFADNDLKSGTQYYRLTQIDFDGQQETFKTLDVTFTPRASAQITVYPNPMKDEVKVRFIAPKRGNATLRIYSEYGHEIYNMSMQIIHDENTFLFNSSSIENGIYFFSIEPEDGTVRHSKVVK